MPGKREKQPQMKCPACGWEISGVRPVKGPRYGRIEQGAAVRRLRRCGECGTDFTTIERVEGIHKRGRQPAA